MNRPKNRKDVTLIVRFTPWTDREGYIPVEILSILVDNEPLEPSEPWYGFAIRDRRKTYPIRTLRFLKVEE